MPNESSLMGCCSTQPIADHFGDARAEDDLLDYRRNGPDRTARTLLQALRVHDLRDTTLLDVGGGIGVISHELLARGVVRATLVDIADAHVRRAAAEAQQRGRGEQLTCIHGDFVDVAHNVPTADVVTLDRVICCYPDAERLITASAAKARSWYALSYPRDRWDIRAVNALGNWRHQRRKESFRTFVYPENTIHNLLLAAGFERRFRRGSFVWLVALYRRRRLP